LQISKQFDARSSICVGELIETYQISQIVGEQVEKMLLSFPFDAYLDAANVAMTKLSCC